jgi:predicted RNA-binding protein with PUA-like domain
MKKKLLITFGCSWVFGIGVGYQEGMSRAEYKDIVSWDPVICNEFSFRGLFSKNLNFDNLNFSQGGSGNQHQFRLAKDFFFSTTFQDLKEDYDDIVVLWGITSTARNELYQLKTGDYWDFFYALEEKDTSPVKGQWPFPKDFVLYSYDHNNAVYELILEIRMFNSFFKNNNIKCIWFDIFNHHDYNSNIKFGISRPKNNQKFNELRQPDWPLFHEYINGTNNVSPEILKEINKNFFRHSDAQLDNFLLYESNPRDLLSLMLISNNSYVEDTRYHFSDWIVDNNKVAIGVKEKLLNPFSNHPTVLGHQVIYKILEPKILKLINEDPILKRK